MPDRCRVLELMIAASLTHSTKALLWAAPFVICAGAAIAYHNSFHGPFVFDDASSIVTNPTIHRLWPLTEVLAGPVTNVTAQGRPLLNLSLAINYPLGGTAVGGYHLGNLNITRWPHWHSMELGGQQC